MKILHRLAHLLKWNEGKIESWWSDGKLMIGFKCAGCGEIQGIHETHIKSSITN